MVTHHHAPATSWLEASARERIAGLLDQNSFREILGPEQRITSPHLPLFELPVAFDDGTIVGSGMLDRRHVLVAAQEGRFMGGTFAEVSGAKLTGILRAARNGAAHRGPRTVLLLLDTGGVRLQEANAGELAVSEVIRAIIEARAVGITVLALVGGKAGAFGGGGIVTASCSAVVVSEFSRISVSGPEVIETNKGVEEFDSKDRALVWRITGGRTRRLLGVADRYVPDRIGAFRASAIALAEHPPAAFGPDTLQREQDRLADRLRRYGNHRDAPDIWRAMGLPDADRIADLDDDAFTAIAAERGTIHDAR